MNSSASPIRFFGNVIFGVLLLSLLIGGPAIPARAQALAVKSDDTTAYTVHKPTYKKGEVDRYKMSINMLIGGSAGENEVNLAFRLKQATKEAGEDGSYTLLQEFEEAKVTAQGAEQDLTSSLPKITLFRDKEGKVTAKTEGGSEQASQITSMLGNFGKSQEAFYPAKPVKIGDKWKIAFDGPAAQETKAKVTGEATLIKTETIGGIKTLSIRVLSDTDVAGADGVKGTNEQVLNIDPETGKLIRMTVNSNIVSQATTLKMKMEMNLLPKETNSQKR